MVVADSSNHRVQVFDQQGAFVKEFGQYGNGEAEFDCLAGVSVNRIGQFIISDRSALSSPSDRLSLHWAVPYLTQTNWSLSTMAYGLLEKERGIRAFVVPDESCTSTLLIS